jgi:ABC-type dipeptide/oligopeptide/nickel transport system ATPase component
VTTLELVNVVVSYQQRDGRSDAVRGVSLRIDPGEIVGMVGASGSGKSSIGYAIMGLLPANAEVSGKILLDGEDLVGRAEGQLRGVRGRRMGMVFQDPSTALNPVFRIRTQIVDTLMRHRKNLKRSEAKRIAADVISEMGIEPERLGSFPHQLSGGMRQRALIAAAMVAQPGLLVADEPTSDLDTVSQAQILRLLRDLRDERGIGILLVSHDMGVIASICDRVGVMRQGKLVELGTCEDVLRRPRHPYTKALVEVSGRQRDADGRFVTMPRDVERLEEAADLAEVVES